MVGRDLGVISPYHEPSSNVDRLPKTHEDDTLDLEPSSESPASDWPSSVYATGFRVIYTPGKSIPLPSQKGVASPHHPQIYPRNLALPITRRPKYTSRSRTTSMPTTRLESCPRLQDATPSLGIHRSSNFSVSSACGTRRGLHTSIIGGS
ncbi:unnamed protein product [Lactuca saligna]|uniref:Uncharacterized protein n=1 Tax=Lactuca saligna TaxID=75948 RepID=A0AA35Z2L8_LACSI|nr:unnamed protein product [Lactuca saligna]